MNYFVSAENTAYQHWQLELLIESFKVHNLQNSLTIALAENYDDIYVNYTFNLSSHPNVFFHENIGRRKKCLGLNRIYSLFLALNKSIISQPITILHPDMILVKPLQEQSNDALFQLDTEFTIEKASCIKDFVQQILKVKKLDKDFWINLGDTICLQTINMEFVKRVLVLANYLAEKQPENAEKIAWILAFIEYLGHLTYYGTFNIENILLDNELKHVIHYKHGLPPAFNKKMFHFSPPNVFSMGDPLDVLLQHNPNIVTNYLQNIIHSYKNRQPKKDINQPINLKIPTVLVNKDK